MLTAESEERILGAIMVGLVVLKQYCREKFGATMVGLVVLKQYCREKFGATMVGLAV